MAKAASSGANLGFEAKLFLTADKLRGSMDASEYKHDASQRCGVGLKPS
jgi:type I restriction enzyme M protein